MSPHAPHTHTTHTTHHIYCNTRSVPLAPSPFLLGTAANNSDIPDHVEDWGQIGDVLEATFVPAFSGLYALKIQYSNGCGPIRSGLTCAVKQLSIVGEGICVCAQV